MDSAIRMAEKAFSKSEVPVGAVVVWDHQIIARGYNQVERLTDATAHAELIAITSASNYMGSKILDECTLYVTLEPCPMCAGAMFWSRLGKLVYGAHDAHRGYSKVEPTLLHPSTEVVGGIMESECSEIVKTFFQKLRAENP